MPMKMSRRALASGGTRGCGEQQRAAARSWTQVEEQLKGASDVLTSYSTEATGDCWHRRPDETAMERRQASARHDGGEGLGRRQSKLRHELSGT